LKGFHRDFACAFQELTESEQHALEQREKEKEGEDNDMESLDDSYFRTDSQYVSRLVNLGKKVLRL